MDRSHYDENDTSVVATYTATDPEDDFVNPSHTTGVSLLAASTPPLSLSEGGVLKFNSSPDYESPTDVGSNADDNIYEVTIQVNDSDTTGASLQTMTGPGGHSNHSQSRRTRHSFALSAAAQGGVAADGHSV